MGLFNFLKNGLTIEKKKSALEDTVETENLEEATEVNDDQVTPSQPTLETASTLDEKRLAAECILYGDTNIGAMPTPTPQPQTQTQTVEQANTTTPPLQQQTFNPYSNTAANFNNALLGQASANQNLLVIAPKSAAEISPILSNLASGNACIVSLAHIADAQRHLDYICGFMNAIGGSILQRTATEYILTPKGVGIKS